MSRLNSRELIEAVVDPGSFILWDQPARHVLATAQYLDELNSAGREAGTDEAVVTGRAELRGRAVALIVSEFGFLGGSIGAVAALRVAKAFRRATAERLPVIALPCSGGTRMQEGAEAFVKMIEITKAVVAHKRAGLACVVYLRHPTTGGALASWGSLGHVTWAEPGALVGFVGPRVVEALEGREFPQGIQRSENLHKKGVIDAVVGLDELPELASRILRLLDPGSVRDTDRESFHVSSGRFPEVEDAWEAILISRHPGRPSTREVLEIGADDHVELAGTGAGEVGTGMVLAVASFDGQSCIVVGHDRRSRAEGLAGPAGLRMARRGIRLAGSLGLPVVTVIDTPGAELSARSEEGALAGEIARCVEDLAGLTVPTVSILLGEGGGGAALALLPAERTIAAEHAWLAPLPPEGGSAIVHRDTRHAPQIARSQGIGARALLSSGTVDCVVREPIPAHLDSARFVKEICHAARRMLVEQMRPDRDGHARAPRVPVP